ncbi:MAG: TIGR04283 family arsenosugar biosynthesis glycosyltransferase [Betaproteobacteria bacterium]|nr:TIGR04283 family arsenosugar biosynthesis glycosyltransferase [Betaproteobacteria bacterium]
MRLTIVIPVLDEAEGIEDHLRALAPLRARGAEVIVVDGGSADDTARLAAPFADRLFEAPQGRAAQLNAGARAARGDALLFLHADTFLPESADRLVLQGLEHARWGRFDVRIASRHRLLAVVARMMNLRSRLTGIATGDQAIFVRRSAFEEAGGFPQLPLMEDIAFSSRLKRVGRPACLRERVVTSGRRWERRGAVRTIVLMWRLRFAYWLGADPVELARRYDEPA